MIRPATRYRRRTAMDEREAEAVQVARKARRFAGRNPDLFGRGGGASLSGLRRGYHDAALYPVTPATSRCRSRSVIFFLFPSWSIIVP